jgi:hypothetical protein
MSCIKCGSELSTVDANHGKINECRDCAGKQVAKYGGQMVWDHKTAPALEIHGSVQSARAASKCENTFALDLRVAVTERSRRREGDLDTLPSYTPYSFANKEIVSLHRESDCARPKVSLRSGSGKTIVTFSRSAIELVRDGKPPAYINGERLELARAVASLGVRSIAGSSITVWQDHDGLYVHPSRSSLRGVLDNQLKKQLGFKGASYERT